MISTIAMLAFQAQAATCTDSTVLTQSSTGEAREPDDNFGWSVAVGDFDDDGLDDLVVGTPFEDWSGETDAGIVTVHYGPVDTLANGYSRWSQNSVTGASNESGDQFSEHLAVGDFNGDGKDDLVMGTPYEDHAGFTRTGRVSVKYGSSSGLNSGNASASWGQNDVPGVGEEDFGFFGADLAVGDFNGDGKDDLAVSSTGSTIDGQSYAGRVVIIFGDAGGLAAGTQDFEAFNINNFGLSPASGDEFGASLAAGDFDGDGADDLAIGVPNRDHSSATDAGMVLVKFSNGTSVKNSTKQLQITAADIGAVARDDDRMGGFASLAAGDLNHAILAGTNYDDLVIGIPKKNVNGANEAGLVGVLWGASTNPVMLASAQNLRSFDAGIAEAAGNEFGTAAHVGNLDADAYQEVVVGAPGASSSEGRIAVFGKTGAGQNLDDTFSLAEGCMGGSTTSLQRFGRAMATGNFGDGPQLVAGDSIHTPNDLGAVFVSTVD